jgi:hypothetical protein
MSEPYSTQSLLALRKLTRAVAETVRTQIADYLATLAPLLRPEVVFGGHVQVGQKENMRRADQALKDLQALYDVIAPNKPFSLRRELTPPFALAGLSIEMTPVEYVHTMPSGPDTKRIVVRSPLMWTLNYSGFAPSRLAELIDPKVRGEELQRFIVSYLVLHLVLKNQPGVTRMLDALHCPISTSTTPEFGDLPMTRIGIGIATERPPDAIVLESAELSGVNAFEEVVQLDDIARLQDPLKDRLMDIVRQQAPAAVTS